MTARKRSRRGRQTKRTPPLRYTVDASVFVNAFNPHEAGHAESLRILSGIQERGDPVIVPTLLVVEIASAVARATGDPAGAVEYAMAAAALPHLTVIPLTAAIARHAADLGARHRLRGADAVYVAVAHRYATRIVTRDEEQQARGGAVVLCQSPEDTLKSLNPQIVKS